MDDRLLMVRRNRHGCILYHGNQLLAWYPSQARALAMAQLLADASELRAGYAPPILLGRHLQCPRPPPRSGQAAPLPGSGPACGPTATGC